MGKGDKQEPEFPPLSDEEPSAQQLEEVSDRVAEAAERVDEVSMEQMVEEVLRQGDADAEIGDRKSQDIGVDLDEDDLYEKLTMQEIYGAKRSAVNQEDIDRDIREMDGLLPASAFPEQKKIKKSVSTKEVRPVLNTKHLKKGGNPIYLKTMKALRGLYKKADRLDAIIFREEYVLPTINGLIKEHQKEGVIPQAKIDLAFEALRGERNEKELKLTTDTGVEINGKIKTRNQLLKSFADASEKAGDQQLAASCKWAIRSLTSKAKHIGKSMVGIKPKKRDENRLNEASKKLGQSL